jgi:hypothetical protein
MAFEPASEDLKNLIAELSHKYIWWKPVGDAPTRRSASLRRR